MTRPRKKLSRALLAASALGILLGLFQLFLWSIFVRTIGSDTAYAGFDFVPTLTAANIVRAGQGSQLYNLETQRQFLGQVLVQYGLTDKVQPPYLHRPTLYLHTPIESLPFAIYAHLPYAVLYGAFTFVSIVALAVCIGLLLRTGPIGLPVGVVLLLLLLSYHPIHQTLWWGQTSLLVLLGLCGAYAALSRGWSVLAGLSLSLVLLKPQLLLVPVLLLVLGRQWKTLSALAFLAVLGTTSVIPWFGIEWPLKYLAFVSQAGYIEPPGMANWRGFAHTVLGDASRAVGPLSLTLAIASLGLFIYAVRRTKMESRGSSPQLWILTVLTSVLALPHLYPYDLAILVLPGWLIVSRTLSATSWTWNKRLLLMLLWAHYALLAMQLIPIPSEVSVFLTTVPTVITMALAAAYLALTPGPLEESEIVAPTAPSGYMAR